MASPQKSLCCWMRKVAILLDLVGAVVIILFPLQHYKPTQMSLLFLTAFTSGEHGSECWHGETLALEGGKACTNKWHKITLRQIISARCSGRKELVCCVRAKLQTLLCCYSKCGLEIWKEESQLKNQPFCYFWCCYDSFHLGNLKESLSFLKSS